MGIVRRTTWNLGNIPQTDTVARANFVKNWFDAFHSPLLEISVVEEADYTNCVICVDQKVNYVLRFYPTIANDRIPFYYYRVIDEPIFDLGAQLDPNIVVTLAISDSVFFVSADNMPNSTRHYVFMYEKIGTKSLYGGGYEWLQRSDPRSIKNFNLMDYDNVALTYTHGTVLNYATTSGTIDFASQDTLTGSDTILDNNFLACSTVSPFQIYTFQGQNYYAASENSLFLSNNSLES